MGQSLVSPQPSKVSLTEVRKRAAHGAQRDNTQQSRRRGRRDLSPRLLHVASDFLTEHSNFKVQTHHLEYS